MKTLRKAHLYLGCLFAPMIIYFALSGAWQVFRFNDVPKGQEPTALQSAIHELSKPHTHMTAPGGSPKTDSSPLFQWISFLMAVGLILTTLLGIILALKQSRSPKIAAVCIAVGIALPIGLLYLR